MHGHANKGAKITNNDNGNLKNQQICLGFGGFTDTYVLQPFCRSYNQTRRSYRLVFTNVGAVAWTYVKIGNHKSLMFRFYEASN